LEKKNSFDIDDIKAIVLAYIYMHMHTLMFDFQHWFKCPCPDKSFTAGVGRQWKQDNGDVDKYQ
jgi:hypothetical protein